MTDRVNPSINATAEARLTSAAIQYLGLSKAGWVVKSANDIMATEAGLTGAPLNAFNSSHSSGSLTATIDTGEAFVGGAWVGRDTTTNVTLAASTNDQDVYVGYDKSAGDTVIVGLSSAFASDDPKTRIWSYDTDGSGVTSAADVRSLGKPFDVDGSGDLLDESGNVLYDQSAVEVPTVRLQADTDGDGLVENYDEALIKDGGSREVDAAELGGSSGSSGQLLESNGSAANWVTVEKGYSEVNNGSDLTNHNGSNGSTPWTLLDVTGSGILLGGCINSQEGGNGPTVDITVDGGSTFQIVGNGTGIFDQDNGTVFIPPIEFSSSIKIDITAHSGGSAGNAVIKS